MPDNHSRNGADTPTKTAGLKPAWQPGQSGNPTGRPRGSRNKLTDAFIGALCEDFEEHGGRVIERVRIEDPGDYLRLVARVVAPVRVALSSDEFGDWSPPELVEAANTLREQIRARINGRGSDPSH